MYIGFTEPLLTVYGLEGFFYISVRTCINLVCVWMCHDVHEGMDYGYRTMTCVLVDYGWKRGNCQEYEYVV